jgi:hypothetical protein
MGANSVRKPVINYRRMDQDLKSDFKEPCDSRKNSAFTRRIPQCIAIQRVCAKRKTFRSNHKCREAAAVQ